MLSLSGIAGQPAGALSVTAASAAPLVPESPQAPPTQVRSLPAAPLVPEHPQAPPFKIRSVTGDRLELEKLLQKGPVLLDFWATWCKPCLAAIPELERIHEEFGPRGLTVIGVSTDGPNNYAKVRPFASRLGIRYPVALDGDGSMASRYQVRAMPTTILIDASGKVRKVSQGYRPGEGVMLRAAIASLFGDRAATDSIAAPDSAEAPAVSPSQSIPAVPDSSAVPSDSTRDAAP